MSTTSTQYTVTGLTCGHCADAVTTELEAIDGVHHVRVDLVAGGESTVTREQVTAALDEAGDYHLIAD